jgi:nucleoside-diphosphate-sugar epimerase
MTNCHLIGATGFLGENFCRLTSDITSVSRNLPFNKTRQHLKLDSIRDYAFLDDEVLDNVIFLIGSSDHQIINKHPTLAFEKNVLPLASFLHYCQNRRQRPKKIITFTTMLQYDSDRMSIPCDEKQPIKPYVNNYVLSKVMAENISELYRESLPIIDIRLSNVYGPTHLKRPDIVPSLIEKINLSDEATVWTKKPKRDFVYVEDVVKWVHLLFETDFSGPVNLGSGVSRSIGELCDILSSQTGVAIGDEGITVDGHMEYYHDLTLLNSLIGPVSPTSLEVGLAETLKYNKFIQNNK